MTKMDDEEIVSTVERIKTTAESYVDGKLSSERREVLEYYRGEKPRPQHTGNSKYVSMDVYDATDTMRAQILEAFSAHQRIVQFAPSSADDVALAEQATDYCSYVFFRRNNGERINYDILTDGLLGRYGVAKVWVEDEAGVEQSFEGLTEDELGILMEEEGIEPSEITQDGQLFSGKGRKSGSKRIKVAAVPLEEILISPDSSCAENADVIHRTKVTKGWLLRQGYPKSIVDDLPEAGAPGEDDYEKEVRTAPFNGGYRSSDYNPSRVWVDYYEAYVSLDVDGTGIEEMWRVIVAGEALLEKAKVKRHPFVFFVPLPTPHTPFGENFAKFVIPTQNARSVLIRGILDHTVITNNPRMMVMNGTLMNPVELQDSRLGGLVNVRRMDGILPLPQSQLNPFVFQTIQLLDEDKEEATGISKLSQGLNKDAISKQNSQGLVDNLINASMTRQKIIARQYGSFLKNLYLLIYDMAVEHMNEQEFVDVSGAFVPVNPASWDKRTDVTVDLTLGPADALQVSQKYLMMDQFFSGDPRLAGQYGPEQRYEVLKRVLKKQGVMDVESVLLPPSKVPPQEPSPMEQLQMEQLKATVALTMAQAQSLSIRNQIEQRKVEGKITADAATLQLKSIELAHEIDMGQREMEMAENEPDKTAVIAPNG